MNISRRYAMTMLGAVGLAAATPARADETLAWLASPDNPDGVLGLGVIARGPSGDVVFEAAQGRRWAGGREAGPFTLETPARVASISKMPATWALMRLVEGGRIGLDEDVSEATGFRLRHPRFPDEPITIRRLASHTAGLRDGANFPVPLGRRLEEALVPDGALFEEGGWWSPSDQPPGFFAYSNANAPVLAQIIERLTGERFDRLMARTVFEPLGLDAGFNWSGVSQAKRDLASACGRKVEGVWQAQVDGSVPPAPGVAVFADAEQPGLAAADYRLGDNGFAFSPQGGLRASVGDLDVLGRMLRSHALMAEPVWTFDGTNGDTDRGLILGYGLHCQATGLGASDAFFGPGSDRWRGHFGEAYGLVSGLFWNLDDGRQIAWIINGTPGDAAVVREPDLALTPWERRLLRAGPHHD